MSKITFTYNKHIGNKKLAVTDSTDPDRCYTWSINGSRPIRQDGVKVVYYACTGCTAMRAQWKKNKIPCEDYKLPLRKADGITDTWIDTHSSYSHFCVPKKCSEVDGLGARRSMQAELATGTRENIASSVVRTEKKILIKLAGKSAAYRQEARQAGVANRNAVAQGFSRARKKQFPLVPDFKDVLNEDKFILRCTERGSIPEHEKYGEQLLLFGDTDMLLFSSQRQLFYLRESREIVCDGNFKYKPQGEAYQVYRIFGFVKEIHSTPLVTVLLEKKDKQTYRKMWRELARPLNEMNGQLKWEIAHFDDEPAVYSKFKRQFPDVEIKMCSFHVKQALTRQVQEKDWRQHIAIEEKYEIALILDSTYAPIQHLKEI